ncbi:hypothetical protein [Streptomyces fodineus]|uniref:hypothetical protein n=1 Tax=Streptomyces fodineus TaxID=1904616 RepID=UPI000AB0A820
MTGTRKSRSFLRAGVAVPAAGVCGAYGINLVGVRAGRAAGAVLALGAPGPPRKAPGAGLSAAAMGAAAAVPPDGLGERTMTGDAGAHARGAALGAAVVAGDRRAGLLAHAAAVVAATVTGTG